MLREKLASCLAALEEFYARILKSMLEDHNEYVKRLLQFLLYTDRPLRLGEAVDVSNELGTQSCFQSIS